VSVLVLIAIGAAAVIAALLALGRLAAAPREWSDEEYERRRRAHGSGVLAATMKTLAEEIDPGGKRAAEERAALERGAYQDEQRAGEPPGTGPGGG
jgi:hypothetical protein